MGLTSDESTAYRKQIEALTYALAQEHERAERAERDKDYWVRRYLAVCDRDEGKAAPAVAEGGDIHGV